MVKYLSGILTALGIFSLGVFYVYAINRDLNQAINYPEKKLGFAFKQEFKNHPEDCLAENNKEDYNKNPENYNSYVYCIHTNLPITQGFSRSSKECKEFIVRRACIEDLVIDDSN